jgi:hypothetical protein
MPALELYQNDSSGWQSRRVHALPDRSLGLHHPATPEAETLTCGIAGAGLIGTPSGTRTNGQRIRDGLKVAIFPGPAGHAWWLGCPKDGSRLRSCKDG